MPPRVLHLSTYDTNGGAARAAYALHRSMVDAGMPSRLRVAHKGTSDPTVIGPSGVRSARVTAAQVLDRQAWRLQSSPNDSWRSPAVVGSLSAREIDAVGADVVNLHWVTDGFLSVEQIGRIRTPIVWSLVDMWPFSGTEHYGADTPDARWRTGYTTSNRSPDERGIDLDRLTWERKRRAWTHPMRIVASNSWMRDRVADSALFRTWPSHQIPHVIDCARFMPADEEESRRRLGLPVDVPLILFISSGGVSDRRKGWDLLAAALPAVRQHHPDVQVVVAGPPDPGTVGDLPVIWQGQVDSDETLARLYAAVDVTAVPSREDNMPLVAMEAQSSGCPVVAFRIGGLPDIVEHRVTGYLAQPLDSEDLALGLVEALGAADQWAPAARERALRTWSPDVVVERYADLYAEILR